MSEEIQSVGRDFSVKRLMRRPDAVWSDRSPEKGKLHSVKKDRGRSLEMKIPEFQDLMDMHSECLLQGRPTCTITKAVFEEGGASIDFIHAEV